jgi:hypothetical protein
MGRDAGYLVTDFSRNGSFVEGGAKLPFGKAAAVECGATLCLGNRRNSFILTVTEL